MRAPLSSATKTCLVVLASWVVACTGEIQSEQGFEPFGGGEPTPMTGKPKPGTNPGTGGTGTPKPGTGGSTGTNPENSGNLNLVPATGLRRLTKNEYFNTIQDLVGVDVGVDIDQLPNDASDERTPFDNNYLTQSPSRPLVEGARTIAEIVTDRVLGDAALRSKTLTCVPAGPADSACLRKFITAFGQRALRRPLTAEEVDRYAAFQSFSVTAGDFNKGLSMVMRALLQDVEFLYRVEIGTPVPGTPALSKLNSYEVASRLSYFLWATMPDDMLLATAAKNELSTPAQIRAAATRMLETPRAKARMKRFHAMWLDYEHSRLPSALDKAMQAETSALIDRILYTTKTSWLELFNLRETYVDKALATQRGLHIRRALMCQIIPPPPPEEGINVDAQPAGAKCKSDSYAVHAKGTCAGCHKLIDPVGLGLENYDMAGKYRTTEPIRTLPSGATQGGPDCPIPGDGELAGIGDLVGKFRGPGELGDRLIESNTLQSCLSTQLFRFYAGRGERGEDDDLLLAMNGRFKDLGYKLPQLLLELVGTASFVHRLPE